MIDPGLYRLKQADYSQRGETIFVKVDGIAKPQTVIFSIVDCFGEKCYLTEEGMRYIIDSRTKRPEQWFVLNHYDKIATILRSPIIVGKSKSDPDNYLYFKPIAVKERHYKVQLFVVALKKSGLNVVWNFYCVEGNRIPEATEVLYKTKDAKKHLR